MWLSHNFKLVIINNEGIIYEINFRDKMQFNPICNIHDFINENQV